jgi:hypothetical protein
MKTGVVHIESHKLCIGFRGRVQILPDHSMTFLTESDLHQAVVCILEEPVLKARLGKYTDPEATAKSRKIPFVESFGEIVSSVYNLVADAIKNGVDWRRDCPFKDFMLKAGFIVRVFVPEDSSMRSDERTFEAMGILLGTDEKSQS